MTLDLRKLDDAFEAAGREHRPGATAGTATAVAEVRPPVISNGFYTVTFPDGSHRTFRIRTERNGVFAGRRTFAMLIGPDNTADYEGIGFVTDDGIQVWKRFKNTKQADYAMIVWMMAVNGVESKGHELLVSKRCLVCNHLLTDDESIRTEIGPTCRKRLGVK